MENQLSKYIIAFIAVIVGLVLITAIGETITPLTSQLSQTNETLDITSAKTAGTEGAANGNGTAYITTIGGMRNGNNITSIKEIRQTNNTLFVQGTDYAMNVSTGKLSFYNTTRVTGSLNTTYVSYSYTGSSYINESTSRMLTSIILLFFAIGIIAIAIKLTIDNDLVGGLRGR